jgi:hypothetical protein
MFVILLLFDHSKTLMSLFLPKYTLLIRLIQNPELFNGTGDVAGIPVNVHPINSLVMIRIPMSIGER